MIFEFWLSASGRLLDAPKFLVFDFCISVVIEYAVDRRMVLLRYDASRDRRVTRLSGGGHILLTPVSCDMHVHSTTTVTWLGQSLSVKIPTHQDGRARRWAIHQVIKKLQVRSWQGRHSGNARRAYWITVPQVAYVYDEPRPVGQLGLALMAFRDTTSHEPGPAVTAISESPNHDLR